MSQLSYNDARREDLPAIVSIYNSTVESRMVTADTEAVSVESRVAWFEQHHPDTRPLWVVQNEAKDIIGWASFQNFYGRPAYAATAEISIYLHPDQRGKGYGREVLHYCIQACPSLGIRTLLAYIFAHNEPSLQLFGKLGFAEWGYFPDIAELDGVARSLKILGRRIVPAAVAE